MERSYCDLHARQDCLIVDVMFQEMGKKSGISIYLVHHTENYKT